MSLRLSRAKLWKKRVWDDSSQKASQYYKGRKKQLDLSYVRSVQVKWNPLYPGGHCARAFKHTLKNNEFAEDHALKCEITEHMHDDRVPPTMEFVLRTPQNTTLKFDTQYWQWQDLVKELVLWCDYARSFDESQKYDATHFDWEIMRKQLLDDYGYTGVDSAKLRGVDDDDDQGESDEQNPGKLLPKTLRDPHELDQKRLAGKQGGKKQKQEQSKGLLTVKDDEKVPSHVLPKLPPTHYTIIYQQGKLQWQDLDQPTQPDEWNAAQAHSGPVLPTVDGRRVRNNGFISDRSPQWIHDYRALSHLEDSLSHIDFKYIVTDDHGLVYPQIPQINDRRWRSQLTKQLGHYSKEMKAFCKQRNNDVSELEDHSEQSEQIAMERRDPAVLAKESQWRKIV